jgi:hypothetical protein
MNPDMRNKLNNLRDDYQNVTGVPFTHFFCPILYRDEKVKLCRGHIINHRFEEASRCWTIQRQDIDNFYGSNFESEFVLIQYRGKLGPFEALQEKTLNPKIRINGEIIDYYHFNGNLNPEDFTPVIFTKNGEEVILVVKIPPSEVERLKEDNWEIENKTDLMIPSIVSLIKAAHLTLFEILGYSYIFSKGGHFIGKKILGKFFEKNQNKTKSEIKIEGLDFFSKYQSIIRPVNSIDRELSNGSIRTGKFVVCHDLGEKMPWAYMVFISFVDQIHVVLIPYAKQSSSSLNKYLKFVEQPRERFIIREKKLKNGQSLIQSKEIEWPKNIEYLA